MEDLDRFQELLKSGSDFVVTYNDKQTKNHVWLSPNLSSINWAESRKAWRHHEKRITGDVRLINNEALLIPIGNNKTIALSGADATVLADWNKGLKLLCGTSTPFDVKHHSHVDTNLEWTGDLSLLFEIEAFLGKGSFGSVNRVRHRDSGAVMAAKLVVADNNDEIKKEIDILRACRHRSIVSYYGCGSVPDRDGNLWILMDYCDGGDVGQLLKRYGSLPEPIIQYIMLQATRATAYLHAKSIMHRDIKSGNILLTKSGDVKLGDFGVSKLVSVTISKRPEMAGSPLWMSPEVIKGRPVSFNTDVWSLGITAIELAEGRPPRSEMSSYQIMKAIAKEGPPSLSQPNRWSAQFRDFVVQCLICDSESRPDSIAILSHPFLALIGSNEDKLLQQFRQLLNGKQRQHSSFGAKLKDITDKAQRAISWTNSPITATGQDEQSESNSTTCTEPDDNSSVILNQEDGSGYSTAVIRSEFDTNEAELAQQIRGSAEPEAFIASPAPITDMNELKPALTSKQIVTIAAAIAFVALAVLIHWAR